MYTSADLPSVSSTVKGMVKVSEDNRGVSHESQWVSKIVTPIMSLIQGLASSTLGGRNIRGRHEYVSML